MADCSCPQDGWLGEQEKSLVRHFLVPSSSFLITFLPPNTWREAVLLCQACLHCQEWGGQGLNPVCLI